MLTKKNAIWSKGLNRNEYNDNDTESIAEEKTIISLIKHSNNIIFIEWEVLRKMLI